MRTPLHPRRLGSQARMLIEHAAASIKLETIPGRNWYQLPYHPVDARRILRTAVRDYGYASVAAIVDPAILDCVGQGCVL